MPRSTAAPSEPTPGRAASSAAQLTPKGQRTRASLVQAAAEVFSREKFLDARVADISETAGVAHGTFYTYFSSKEEVFKEVILGVQRDMASDGAGPPLATEASPWTIVETANRQYLRAYRRNAELMATLEQVATFNDDVRRLRLELRDLFVVRNTRAITRWQESGIADPEINACYAANALGTMVDRFAYTWFVLGQEFEEDLAVETLTRMWLQALGVDHGHRSTREAPRASLSRASRTMS